MDAQNIQDKNSIQILSILYIHVIPSPLFFFVP